jgi:hypothetical protein
MALTNLLTATGLLVFSAVGAASFYAPPVPPKCDMEVKDGPNGLLWRCVEATCSNCGISGTCTHEAAPFGQYIMEGCICKGAGGQAGDACSTVLTVDTITGAVGISCWNFCCGTPCPAPGGPYPGWSDPCPC